MAEGFAKASPASEGTSRHGSGRKILDKERKLGRLARAERENKLFGEGEIAGGMIMKWFHALIIALGIVLAGALIAGSNLWWSRYEHVYNPSTTQLMRIDKATGEVSFFDPARGWIKIPAR
jgi:hypothetical protein